jgi:predicted  nucleic acid-binding Zn-ribbon protein
MSQPFTLYRLQQLDSQLDRTQLRLAEIQVALNEAQELRQAEEAASQTEAALQAARKVLQKADEAVKEQRIKIATTEAALYGGKVRNPKELQDLQNESAALKRYLNVLEDRELEAMLAEEEAVATNRDAQIALELAQAKHAAHQNDLVQEQKRLEKEVPRLGEERQATANTVPSDEMALYETLRKQRRGLAVTLVKNKACTSCGSTLNAILLDAALTSGQLTRCDGCGRILYVG